MSQTVDDMHFWQTLALWAALERAYGFVSSAAGLSATGQPEEVKWWIGRARPLRVPDSLSNPVKFSIFKNTFWSWWISLQPSWQKGLSGVLSWEVKGDWGQLVSPGCNGILTVIACLNWWHHKSQQHSSEGEDLSEDVDKAPSWEDAIQDVCWVISELLNCATSTSHGAPGSKR
jgi:hypothetical protein